MGSLFLDTSFIIALEDADDRRHERAVSVWKDFKRYPKNLVTTTYIFDETVTFLKRHMGHEKAADVGTRLLSSSIVEMVHISQKDFETGWEMFLKYKDKGFSFTDCLSFLVMEQKGLKEALTFDEHFGQMGFKMAGTHV